MSNYLDNTVSTRVKFDQRAQHNVRAYRSAYRNEMNRETGAGFLLSMVGLLLWYVVIYPTLFVLHFLFQYLLSFFTDSKKVQNMQLRNPLK